MVERYELKTTFEFGVIKSLLLSKVTEDRRIISSTL